MAHIKERSTRRGTVYDVRWEAAPGRERSRTFRTMDEALLARISVERGDEPTKLIPDTTTFGEFWDAWEARWRIGKRPKTVSEVAQARKNLDPLLSIRLPQLTAAMAEDEISRLASHAPRAAQQALKQLKACLRSAQVRDHKIDTRILALSPPKHLPSPPRFLTWNEVERVQAFLDPRVGRIVPVAALTGMRRGELAGLTDDRLDLGEGSVTLRVTKSRRPRKVWLSGHARLLLKEQLVARTPNKAGLVFPTRSGSPLGTRFEKSYREAVKLACVDGATFHALRHTAVSLMIRAGLNPLEIAEQIGHERNGRPDASLIWQRYGWLYENATRSAVRKMDAVILEADEAEAEAR